MDKVRSTTVVTALPGVAPEAAALRRDDRLPDTESARTHPLCRQPEREVELEVEQCDELLRITYLEEARTFVRQILASAAIIETLALSAADEGTASNLRLQCRTCEWVLAPSAVSTRIVECFGARNFLETLSLRAAKLLEQSDPLEPMTADRTAATSTSLPSAFGEGSV